MKKYIVALVALAFLNFFGCSAEEKKAPAAPEPPKTVVQAPAQQAPGAVAGFALVRESAGPVNFRRGGAVSPAPAGTALLGHDTLICDKDGSATVEFSTGTVLKLNPGAFVRLDDVEIAGAKTVDIALVMGRIWLKVARLAGAQRLEVATPTAVAGVRGTQFHVAVAADGSTRLGVEEGAVEVRTGKTSRRVERSQEVVVETGKGDAVQESLKLDQWEKWMESRKADLLKDPGRVAAAISESVAAAGAASADALTKAEAASAALEKAGDAEKAAQKAVFSQSVEEVRLMQDAAEVQMECLGKIMRDLSAEPSASKAGRDAVEAEIGKARQKAADAAENARKARDLDSKLKTPAGGAGHQTNVQPPPAKASAPGSRPGTPEAGRKNPASGVADGLDRMAAHATEAVKEMEGGEKKVASLDPQPRPEDAAVPARPTAKAASLPEFEKAFKECEARLDSVSAQGELYDGKTRAGMVRAEARKISALLPGLRILADDLDRKAREARDASEGRNLLQQGQKVRVFIKQCESKVLWCDQQAAHYEAMKAE